MIQLFHWYLPADGSFWNFVSENAKYLADLGITAAWLPPPTKAKEASHSIGYDVYDLYDLGEFDQLGSVRTKYGTRKGFEAAVSALELAGISVYVDVVFNHKAGADETELIQVVRVNPENRTEIISEPFDIEAYTKFTFPGRGDTYSNFVWDHRCFSGVDYAHNLNETGIFSIVNDYGVDWEQMVDDEKGNYDYLMFCDIEFRNPAVREELKNWGSWLLEQVPVKGARLDAVKHISPNFYNEWLDHMRSKNPDFFAVGEYWAPGNLELLLRYIDSTEGRMSLFDSSLHHNLHEASNGGNTYDLTKIFDSTLTQSKPDLSVTVTDNHDTQPLQALEAPVENWFKPHAYALILLREAGYPCIFFPDLFGAHYKDHGSDGNEYEIFIDKTDGIETLIQTRKNRAFGTQRDYFDHPNCIGWTREGIEDIPQSGCAVLLSNGEGGNKNMEIGTRHAGKIFVDCLQKNPAEVRIDESGWAEFYCMPGSVSVWVEKEQ